MLKIPLINQIAMTIGKGIYSLLVSITIDVVCYTY